MAYNMQVAFATTVVGLTVSAIGFCTQQAKERWAVARVALLEYLAQVTGDARNAERRAVQWEGTAAAPFSTPARTPTP